MSAGNSYCRLCAALKTLDKLINLKNDEQKRREVVEKLTRIYPGIDFINDELPKTVCISCVSLLDKAFDFVVSIEQAQGALTDILLVQKIKKEADENDFSDEDLPFDPPEVKDENVNIKHETEDTVPKKVRKTHNKKKKDSRINLDAIPLSELKLSWKGYIWRCTYCDTRFSDLEELRAHSMQFHDCCNAFRCVDCRVRKLNLDSFLVHVKRHRVYLKSSCYKCHAKFGSLHEANKHKNVHKSKHICPGCNTTYPDAVELEQHMSMYYQAQRSRSIKLPERINELTDNLTCMVCNKTFKQRSALNSHILIHTERSRDYTCDKCGKCFLNKQNLAGHMVMHDNSRPFQCEICKVTFKRPGQLRNHIGVHDAKKPFTCEQCGRSFRLQKHLTSHRIIHTDSLPHVCSYCNKRFRFKTILNQHIRQHTGIKPYSCEVCLRDFTNWPNYNKHMKRRHGMNMAKKKHTPEGVYPINPATGEVIKYPQTNQTLEWKKQMLTHKRPGRPKIKEPEKIESSDVQNFEISIVPESLND